MEKLKGSITEIIMRILPGEERSGGMELVQVAILVAIAIALGLIFRSEITSFVNKTFDSLNNGF
ncbi:MAG: Flp1 family type IVb pilin [Bacillota bacterium]|nr:Flp1 family type IVb pilin [Bacillota bacterium]